MRRRVKDFVKISDHMSLDRLINTLMAVRDSLPDEAEPELQMSGDDLFGRHLSISYFRELTPEEAECEARYSDRGLAGPDGSPEEWRQRLDFIPFEPGAADRRDRDAA